MVSLCKMILFSNFTFFLKIIFQKTTATKAFGNNYKKLNIFAIIEI